MEDVEIDRMSEFEGGYWWFVGRRKVIDTILTKEFGTKSNLRILDIGCGTGNTTRFLNNFGEVCGIDTSFLGLKHCIQKGVAQVIKGDSYRLPFGDKSFDLITMLDVLEHIEDDSRILKELRRVLKNDGRLLITVPAYQFLWSEHDVALHHFRRYTSKHLAGLLAKIGFHTKRISYFITFLFPFVALYRLISKAKGEKEKSEAQLLPLPGFIDKTLQKILSFESMLLKSINFPFGVSLICIAKKDAI